VPLGLVARAGGVPVRSEFDLAEAWDDRPLVAITGTNGKTTVTTLVTDMLNASGRRAVAAGNLALMYQAWKDRTGEWPTFEDARALLMGTSRNTKHDVWSQGAGLVNADEGTDVAAGRSGAYATPAEWAPGSYRGKEYGAFANIIQPGQSDKQTFTLWNYSNKPVKVKLDARQLKLLKDWARLGDQPSDKAKFEFIAANLALLDREQARRVDAGAEKDVRPAAR